METSVGDFTHWLVVHTGTADGLFPHSLIWNSCKSHWLLMSYINDVIGMDECEHSMNLFSEQEIKLRVKNCFWCGSLKPYNFFPYNFCLDVAKIISSTLSEQESPPTWPQEAYRPLRCLLEEGTPVAVQGVFHDLAVPPPPRPQAWLGYHPLPERTKNQRLGVLL